MTRDMFPSNRKTYLSWREIQQIYLNYFHAVCEKPVELVIMIDSSESVGLKNFNSIKKMVDKTLTLFTISEKNTHVGVIVIDSVPHIELNLNTLKGNNFTQDHVVKVVDSLQFISGQTRIDLALRMARKEVFSKSRKDARKVIKIKINISPFAPQLI